MKKITKKTSLILLVIWFSVVATVYYIPVRLESTFGMQAVFIVYAVLSLVFLAAFLLVNGGFSRIEDDAAKRMTPFKFERDKRVFFSKLFLILAIPFILIFFVDYIYIMIKDFFA